MKTLLRGSTLMLLLTLTLSCEPLLLFDLLNHVQDGPACDVTYGPPQPVRFIGYTDFTPCGEEVCFDCPETYPVWNIQKGKGTFTDVGKVDIYFEFCVRPEDPETMDGLVASYGNLSGYIQARNGDKMYLKLLGEGKIYLTDEEGVAFFRDVLIIEGGTGRFECASGKLITDSYNFGVRTEHVLSGTLMLPN